MSDLIPLDDPELRQGLAAPHAPTTGTFDSDLMGLLKREYLSSKLLPQVDGYGMPKNAMSGNNYTIAWTDQGRKDPNIHVNTNSKVYKRALGGDLEAQKMLAAVLVHENRHLQPGGDVEGPSYDEQLSFLRGVGAQPKTIKHIEDTKNYILSGRR